MHINFVIVRLMAWPAGCCDHLVNLLFIAISCELLKSSIPLNDSGQVNSLTVCIQFLVTLLCYLHIAIHLQCRYRLPCLVLASPSHCVVNF